MAERKSTESSKKPADTAKPTPKDKPKKPPEADLKERMEGVQGWMAELEKRQERTSRAGGLAVVLAILASGAALALGILNKQDAATTDDVDELTSKVNELGASVEQQTEKQLKGINQRLASLEQQLASLNERQRKAEADIATLKSNQNTAAANAAATAKPAPDAGAGAENQP